MEPGWPHTSNPDEEQASGALAFASAPAAAEPRGYQRGGWFIPVPGDGAVSDPASERYRRLLIAGRLGVAQVHSQRRVTARSPRS